MWASDGQGVNNHEQIMYYLRIIALATFSITAATAVGAQGRIRVESPRRLAEQGLESRVFSYDTNRPQLGIAVTSTGAADTLGVLVDDVTKDSPAARAGIQEGDRLQSINGVNLRLSAADAEADDMQGVATRRLVRELGKMKVGDEASLGVFRDGRTLTLRATTVSAEELSPLRTALRRGGLDSDRAAIGIGLAATGSRRDTAGVLIASVVDGGPADKARIEEGDRIAAVNGVDLRVPSEDAGDAQVSSTRLRRFYKEIEELKAGDKVELRLIRAGQSRTVSVTAVPASELPARSGFSFSIGEGGGPQVWFGGEGAIRSIPIPRGGANGGVYFFDRDGEGASGRSFVIPRGSGEGFLLRDRDGSASQERIEGRMKELLRRFDGLGSNGRRIRITTQASAAS